ncbi:hypothetical protein N0V90_004982 [Kalmusia sp. IMI 367209]|nr:hypothetical protein N0V90_004982 [Kalmusia sp. IMI 367209]
MVSTRSKTTQTQTQLEDFLDKGKALRGRKSTTEGRPSTNFKAIQTTPKKRKAHTSTSEKLTPKRTKTAQPNKRADSAQARDVTPVLINRAPVLQLWSACVTQLLYPSLSWSTCVSVGSAISTICAVAKGRSIGKMSERNDSEEANRKRKEAKKKQGDLEEIQVMHFNLKLKDGLAIVGSEQKGKPANEDALKKNFGEAQYERTRKCFENALNSWMGVDEEQLDKDASHFYEEFRPTVKSGQKGWGSKGELNLENVNRVVQK